MNPAWAGKRSIWDAAVILVFSTTTIIVKASDRPAADDSKHKWVDQEKFGTELPISGCHEGMADMVSEGTLKKYATSKYPAWYRGTGKGSASKEDAPYYYRAAVGPPSRVSTGLEANHFSRGTMTFKPGTIYPIHNHPAWEVCYVLEGEGIIRKYDREYKIKPGDCFMNRPYDVHAIINTSDEKPLRVISGVGEFSAIKSVIPAKAGIQKILSRLTWMPAFAGMTGKTPRPVSYLDMVDRRW